MGYQVTRDPLAGVEARPGGGHYAIFDHGAHAWAWQPDGHRPVLWLSRHSRFAHGHAIRGGVPVVFPWFGTGPGGDRRPAHGFGRLQRWTRRTVDDTLDTDGRLAVDYVLDSLDLPDQPDFPFTFSARLRATFTPDYFGIDLGVVNADDRPFRFESALHTYLAVSDVREVALRGLDGLSYLDKTASGPPEPRVQDGELAITGETDRIYGEHGPVVLDDPGWQRALAVADRGAANLVVWNPWVTKAAALADLGDDEWTQMICLEAANIGDHAITLQPGESHLLSQRITLA